MLHPCFYCQRKVKKLNFDSFISRQKATDKIIKEFKNKAKDRKVVVAMQSRGFSSSYKGNMPALKGNLLKELDTNFQMHMVHEYKTSLICNACYQECQPVRHFILNKRQRDIGVFVTRDLNQCTTTGCLIIHDREKLNTAKNILTIFKSKERPEPFKKNKKKEKLIEKRLNKLIQELETAMLSRFNR
jgi:hypothetical protein